MVLKVSGHKRNFLDWEEHWRAYNLLENMASQMLWIRKLARVKHHSCPADLRRSVYKWPYGSMMRKIVEPGYRMDLVGNWATNLVPDSFQLSSDKSLGKIATADTLRPMKKSVVLLDLVLVLSRHISSSRRLVRGGILRVLSPRRQGPFLHDHWLRCVGRLEQQQDVRAKMPGFKHHWHSNYNGYPSHHILHHNACSCMVPRPSLLNMLHTKEPVNLKAWKDSFIYSISLILQMTLRWRSYTLFLSEPRATIHSCHTTYSECVLFCGCHWSHCHQEIKKYYKN